YGARVRITATSSLMTDMIRSSTWIGDWLKEGIGVFQYLDTPMPSFAYTLYALAFALLAMAALWQATSRERLMFVLSCLGAVAVSLGLYCTVVQATGFGLQGRFILPFVVIVPLFEGELFRRHWLTIHPLVRRATLGTLALVSFLQFLGLY